MGRGNKTMAQKNLINKRRIAKERKEWRYQTSITNQYLVYDSELSEVRKAKLCSDTYNKKNNPQYVYYARYNKDGFVAKEIISLDKWNVVSKLYDVYMIGKPFYTLEQLEQSLAMPNKAKRKEIKEAKELMTRIISTYNKEVQYVQTNTAL